VRATSLIRKNGRVAGVIGRAESGHSLTVHADTVVSACGAITGVSFLHQVGVRSRHLGRHLTIHPGVKIVAQMPEVVNGWRFDQRADVYSFGVTVYEMLTQVKPFEGQTAKEKLTNQLNPKYLIRKPRKFNPNIPLLLEELILKCIEYVPEKRYLTMGIMARDLHKVMGVH
jgi:hypothetical protein